MNTLLRAATILLIPFVWLSHAVADEPAGADANVVKRFAVAKNGDGLRLPVLLKDKTYSFFLDTGVARTCFDVKFPLGRPIDDVLIQTAIGVKTLKWFPAPAATVAGLPITNEKKVIGLDLKQDP